MFADVAASEMYEIFEVENIENAAPSDTDITFSEDIAFSDGLKNVFLKVREGISKTLAAGIRCVAIICAVSFMLGLVESMSQSSSLKTSLSLVGAVAVAGAASESVSSVMGMGREFISGIDVFSKALLPSVAAAEAACGLVSAATVKATATLVFSDLLITLINSFLMPLVYVILFSATANAAAKNPALEKISGFASKIVSVTLKLALGAFVSYISISGLVSSGADKAGVKVAQFALGTAVPIVGSVVSEAAETVIAGAAMIKNAIGIFGMLTILSAFATPFATMLVNYLTFKVSSLVASPVIGGDISVLTAKIAECFGLILAMCASVATVILISVIAAMRSIGVL